MPTRVSRNGRPVPPPLTVTVRNLGPIGKAVIELKPVTVLIGPNNCGKSYTTTSIFTVLRTVSRLQGYDSTYSRHYPLTRYGATRRRRLAVMHASQSEAIGALVTESLMKDLPAEFEVPHQILTALLENYEKAIGAIFESEAVKAFAVPLSDLKRGGSYNPKIVLQKDLLKLVFRIGKKGVRASLEYPERASLSVSVDKQSIKTKIAVEGTTLTDMTLSGLGRRRDLDETRTFVLFAVERTIQRIMEPRYLEMHYLPAARAGIAQTYKTLAAGSTLLYPLLGLDDLGPQRFSGAIADLTGLLISIDELRPEPRSERGDFSSLSDEFEMTMTGGRILVKRSPRGGVPDIVFIEGGLEHPIHAAASSVAEIAPIMLFVRYLLRPQSLFVIEEPEAHQHPSNQLMMARLLARVVNRDVDVMITTHSEYILESLSILMRASSLRKAPGGFVKEELISPGSIGVYLFVPDKKGRGTISAPQRVDPVEGIDQESFNRVIEALYGDARQVDSALMKEKLPKGEKQG